MGATRRLDHYDPSMGWQCLFVVAGVGVVIIVFGVLFQIAQIIVSIKDRKQNLDTTGDPWNGRTLEWSTSSPPPVYNFAILPKVTTRDAFWQQKEDAHAGGHDHAKNGLTLPRRTTNLSISYTAPSLYIPERVRFKYKLLGVDSDWQEAGQRREAFYTNLRPGSYTFTVIAANDDGAWTKEGASLRFLITPTFYQTAWFIVFCVAMAFLAVLAVFVIRLRQLAEGARMRAEVRNLERERIARELHDTLLQTVQGLVMRFHAVALRMPEGDPNRRTLESALDAAGNAIDEGRDRVKQIRGPVGKPIDLEVAFTKLVDELPCEHPVSFRVTTEGQVREFDPFVGDEIYRIGREADVPPVLSSATIWSPIPQLKEIGREEAFYRGTDHRLPA